MKRLDIDFNAHGFDKYGVSRNSLQSIAPYVAFPYENYFSVDINNISKVPSNGRVMLISNHSGGIPTDGFLISVANVPEHDPPRLVHTMVDKFMNNFPYPSPIMRKLGQMVGLPANAKSVLRNDRALLVFPEGARGTGKLYYERYKLIRFGTGFMRIAMETNTPILPVGFVGAVEMVPSLLKLKKVARWFGIPYIPISPQILPIPLPVNCKINFGEPMMFEGDGNESNQEIKENVDWVKKKVCELLNEGLEDHSIPFFPQSEATIERWEAEYAHSG